MTDPLDSLRLLIAADPAVLAELAAADGADAFLAAATALASRHGLALQPSDLAPLLAPDPLGLVEQGPPPLRCTGWPPPGWLPWRLAPDGDGLTGVDWAEFTGVPLDGAFHAAAVRDALARPFNRLLRCRMGLGDFLRGAPGSLRVPDGFVFHMSRCGSTLVARMLAALPDSYAINEAAPIDALLHASAGAPEEVRAAALRTMVGALGARPSRRWFVKLSAWPVLELPLFRLAFPDVPWIFVHRDPAAVIASQMATRGPELDPLLTPPSLFGIADDSALPAEAYCATALARLCEAALASDGGAFVDHVDLPEAFFSTILPHFGIDPDEAPREKLQDIARRHAKHPDTFYRPDPAPIGPAIRAAADAHLGPLDARLKAVRGGKSLL